ncbi:hypothetical protein, partial [Xylella fastidiosa]|uniref:hypothetical protein n=1 Tax=Xylella fastidiosa TaxID=2371 RepID=UPI00111DE3A0
MTAYAKVQGVITDFEEVKIEQITSGQNAHADSLACLASALPTEYKRTVAVEYLAQPSIEQETETNMDANLGPSWMDPIIAYLRDEALPEDKKEAYKVKLKSARFWLSPQGKLYKKSYHGPYLLCVHPTLVQKFLHEIHAGTCGGHAGGRSIAHR